MSSRIGCGRQTCAVAGTPRSLAGTGSTFTDPAGPISGVAVTAETDNTSIVVVGGSDVVAALATRKGTPLSAGQTAWFPVDDLSDVYVDALVNTEGVTFTWAAAR